MCDLQRHNLSRHFKLPHQGLPLNLNQPTQAIHQQASTHSHLLYSFELPHRLNLELIFKHI